MLAANKQIGFFSDAYCAEWQYAKAVLVRKQLASVLATKVEAGQYTLDDAMSIAQTLVYEAPQKCMGVEPSLAL